MCLLLFMCLCMFSFLCLVFSFPCSSCPLCALCTVSTCPGVHVAMCSHCFVFSLCCVLCSHRVQCVCVVIPWRVLFVCCMLLLCVQDVVFVIVCACVQRVKSGVFTPQRIYIKKVHFFENNCCFSCVYEKKAVPL